MNSTTKKTLFIFFGLTFLTFSIYYLISARLEAKNILAIISSANCSQRVEIFGSTNIKSDLRSHLPQLVSKKAKLAAALVFSSPLEMLVWKWLSQTSSEILINSLSTPQALCKILDGSGYIPEAALDPLPTGIFRKRVFTADLPAVAVSGTYTFVLYDVSSSSNVQVVLGRNGVFGWRIIAIRPSSIFTFFPKVLK